MKDCKAFFFILCKNKLAEFVNFIFITFITNYSKRFYYKTAYILGFINKSYLSDLNDITNNQKLTESIELSLR